MNHYTYYSFEEWGRGYIGRRSCDCSPEEDNEYFGSFRDDTFLPTRKIIISTHRSREEAAEAEVLLHEYFQVHINPHFANKAKQSSKKFYNNLTPEQRSKQSSLVTQTNLRETNVFRKKGEESMSHGRVWVTNLDKTEEIYLKPGEEIPPGWVRGRKFRTRSEESRQRTSKALKGKPKSEKARENIRKARLAYLERKRNG
jgi:hypothetical protein